MKPSGHTAGIALAFIHALQIALIVGGWYAHVLSTERMMLMRYLVAKNLVLETLVFSSAGLLAAAAILFVIAGVFLYLLKAKKGHAPLVSFEQMLTLLIVAGSAVATVALKTELSKAAYLMIACTWVVVLLQLFGVAIAFSAVRSQSALPSESLPTTTQ